MKRKEINIFGASFLDLLSGALGAVIILFVIVPKMTTHEQETLQELEDLNIQVNEISSIMEQLENSVPSTLYQQLEQQIEEMRNTISSLTAHVETLQARNAALEEENNQLREQVRNYEVVQRENQAAQERIRQLEERVRELEQELQERQETPAEISGGMIFGTNADLGVVCIWPENVDVDLIVKNIQTEEICYFGSKNHPWGNLLEDVRNHTNGDDRYELFYQKEIVPGTYQISVKIYTSAQSPWNGIPATVDGYVVMHPGKRNQKRLKFNTLRLSDTSEVIVGQLTVTNDNILLQ